MKAFSAKIRQIRVPFRNMSHKIKNKNARNNESDNDTDDGSDNDAE